MPPPSPPPAGNRVPLLRDAGIEPTPAGLQPMKKFTADLQKRMCTGKRRYRTQGDALDAALLAGVERHRTAYLCPLCRHWHLASTGRAR